jgi:hypothetical protein
MRNTAGPLLLFFVAIQFHTRSFAEAATGPSVAVTPTATEAERIQTLLDSRYSKTDVKHSFETEFGESIDCIDFFVQEGVRALTDRGIFMTQIPSPPPLPPGYVAPPLDLSYDLQGRTRSCPPGSVAILRLTRNDILAAGGIDALERIQHRKGPPPRPYASSQSSTSPPDFGGGTGYAHATAGFTGSTQIYSTQAVSAIYSPVVLNSGDHSLAQTWTTSGSKMYGDTPIGCAAGTCFQSLEAGWNVDPLLYSTNKDKPHFFTYATNDGYHTGCYNNSGSLG